MMKSVWTGLRRSLYVVLILISLLLISLLLAVKSQTLSVWLLSQGVGQANKLAPLELDFRSASGTLEQGFTLQGVRLALPEEGGLFSAEVIRLEWDLWALFGGVAHIRHIGLEAAQFDLPNTDSADQEQADPETGFDPESVLSPLFELPLALRLDLFEVDGFRLREQAETLVEIPHFSTAASLDSSALTVSDLQLQMAPLELSAQRWRLDAMQQIEGDLSWQYPTEELPVAGELLIEGTLAALQIHHRLSAPVTFISRGSLETGLVSGEAPFFEMQHEAAIADPAILAQLGVADYLSTLVAELETRGTPEDIGINALVNASVIDVGAVNLDLSARYLGEQLLLQALSVESPYGVLESDGNLSMAPTLSAAFDWRFTAADLGTLPAFPEGITLEGLTAEGSLSHEAVDNAAAMSHFSLARLEGVLNGHALSMTGAVDLQDFAPAGLNLSLQAGSNRLSVSGNADAQLALDWSLQVPAPDELLPGLTGTMSGSGTVRGTVDDPAMAADLVLSELSYALDEQRHVSLESFTVVGSYQDDTLQTELRLDSLLFEDDTQLITVDTVALLASGSQLAHRISLTADSSLGSADIQLTGSLESALWSGALESASVDSLYGNLRLRDSVELVAGASQVTVARHCWDMTGMAISLCADMSRDDAGMLNASADLSGLPLTWLTRPDIASEHFTEAQLAVSAPPAGIAELLDANQIYMPADSLIRGVVDASVAFSLNPESGLPALSLNVMPRDVVLGVIPQIGPAPELDQAEPVDAADLEAQNELIEFALQADQLEVALSEENWRIQSQLSIARIEAEGSIPQGDLQADIAMSAEQALSGSIDMAFNDIAWLASLVPDLRDTRGDLSLQAELAGNLQQPLLETQLSFSEGAFTVVPTGMQVSDIDIQVESDAANNVTFAGQAHSGEGSLRLEGRLEDPLLAESRSLNVVISGDRFRVYDQEGARIEISPALNLGYAGEALSVTGELHIPYFDVIVEQVLDLSGGSAVNTSRDVVLYASEAEMISQQDGTGSQLGVQASIEVSLGEHARLRAYGLDLSLDGAISLEQAVNSPLLAYGEVSVTEGFYEMYGQHLTAERGQLLFFGNPLNPALEIRASREVDTTTVGIQISGTLNSMQSQLYSVPTLPEAEVLAMLVTGRSLNNSNSEGLDNDRMLAAVANLGIKRGEGITSAIQRGLGVDTLEISGGTNLQDSTLGIGKFLTPNLFVSYDVGLFDRQSVLSMIYLLTERIRLEVESGISQSIDLTYTLER